MMNLVKILPEAILARKKLTHYLLVPLRRSDKSGFLARLGFTPKNPDELDAAIRAQASSTEAVVDSVDEYGTHLTVTAPLAGPISTRPVVTVWVRSSDDGLVRFVTLKPLRPSS